MATDKTISELLSYRIGRLSGALSRSAASRYRQDFGVSLGEWRVLALLGEKPDLTLNRLARRAALDKAQMSRVVSKLEDRGMLQRVAGPRRSTQLSLTDAGQVIYQGLIVAANERDQRLVNAVSAKKLLVFEEVMEALHECARRFEEGDDDDSTVGRVNSGR